LPRIHKRREIVENSLEKVKKSLVALKGAGGGKDEVLESPKASISQRKVESLIEKSSAVRQVAKLEGGSRGSVPLRRQEGGFSKEKFVREREVLQAGGGVGPYGSYS